MKKTYFLTAVFENRFGKAKKYFDGKSWHWMLNSDQPECYDTIEEAKQRARQLVDEDVVSLAIKEVVVYTNVWEHIIERPLVAKFLQVNGQPRQTIFFQEQPNQVTFLAREKQWDSATCVQGLYCVNRKQDVWIYCEKTTEKTTYAKKTIPSLVAQAHQLLKETKALMILLEEPDGKVEKVSSLLVLLQKMVSSTTNNASPNTEETATWSPQLLIQQAYTKLEEAQKLALKENVDDEIMEQITRVLLFCRRLL